MKPATRVLVVDDHAFVRDAAEAVIAGCGDLDPVGSAPDGVSAIAQVIELKPDVVVIDFALPDMTGLDAIETLRAAGVGARFVLLTGAPLDGTERDAIAARVEVFLHKEAGHEALLGAIRKAAHAAPLALAPLDPFDASGAVNAGLLTARERAVLREIARGRPVGEIAERLGVSPATVRKHRENVMTKLNLNSTAALVRAAMQIGQY
ncbi:MAG: LuxR C-terminal-related transcriptional regulator [Oceanicaulis sp.]